MIKKLIEGLKIIHPHVEDGATVTLNETGDLATGFEGELKVLLGKKEQDALKELGWKHDYAEKNSESVEERAWIFPLG